MSCAFFVCPFSPNTFSAPRTHVARRKGRLGPGGQQNGSHPMYRSFLGRLDRFQLPDAEGAGSLLAALSINAFGAGMFYPFALIYFTRAVSLGAAVLVDL